MKRLMIIAAWLCSMVAVAQTANVGVNTRTPESTLDVRATKAADSETTNEGILAPRLTKTRVANIATPIEGTLVYVTDVTYTGSNAKVAKVTEKGYYFYNGTEWVKVITPDDPSKWQNDAVNTLVKLKNLSDGVTSRTDAANIFVKDNGNVGIGTNTPATKLELNSATAGAIRIVDGTQAAGKILTSDDNGVGTWQTTAANLILGVWGRGVDIPVMTTPNLNTYYYTGTTITLPANSHYMILFDCLIDPRAVISSPIWMQTLLTDTPESQESTPDISDGKTRVSGAIASGSFYGMMHGTFLVRNTTAASKTYYFKARALGLTETPLQYVYQFGGDGYLEGRIVAIRVQ